MEDSETSESTAKGRSTIGWWLKWIKAAKKAAKTHFEDAQTAWAEYELEAQEGGKPRGGYPIYKTSVDKLESALFAKCPDPRSKRKFGIEDEMALTMALINDRLATHLIEDGNCFEAWCQARGDFIHAAKASVQVVYTTDIEKYRVPLSVSQGEKEAEYYIQGSEEVYEGEVEEEGGAYYGFAERAIEKTQKIKLAPCLYDEILHTPEAKSNAQITEKAYKFCLPYEQAEKMFNADKSKVLPYKTASSWKEEGVSSSDTEGSTPGKVLEGWECYCLESKKIYWVCEEFGDDFLLVEDDTQGLRKFFPSTEFILLNRKRRNLYPTPSYIYLLPTANQLNKLYERIFDLIDSIERRAIVYGASPELIEALNSPGGTYISAGKMLDILEKGGLQNLVQFIPVQELVTALNETIQLEEHFKNNFAEFFHLPEILRGQSDPNQSATQSEILQDEAHDTFRTTKELMIKLARDSVELMLDLAYKVYSDDKIAQIIGYEYLPMGTPEVPETPPSEENPEGIPGEPAKLGHKERFPEALKRLRNDSARLIQIDFETDSSSFRDDRKDLEKMQLIGKTAIDSLQMISGLDAQFIPIGMNMTLAVLEGMGGSTKTEDMIRKAVADLEKIKSQPAPPPPDTEMMKVEMKGQEIQLKAQIEERKLGQKDLEMQMNALKTQAEVEIAKFESQFNAALEKALVQLEQQRVDIAKFQAEVQAQETLLEEIRLRQEADANLIQQATDAAMTEAPMAPEPVQQPKIELPSMPPMNLNVTVHMPKGGKKISKMIRPDGSETIVETDEVAEPESPEVI